MTAIGNFAGCSICAGLPPLCRTCTMLNRVFEAQPDPPLSLEWAQAQVVSAEAKRVLLALMRKTDFETGFTQLSLPMIAREAGLEVTDDYLASEWVRPRLAELVNADLLETVPDVTRQTWDFLGWFNSRGKSNDGVVWFRAKHRDAARAWDGLAA